MQEKMKDTAGLGIWGEGNSLLSSASSADVQPLAPIISLTTVLFSFD
jgi:hypothetical protein